MTDYLKMAVDAMQDDEVEGPRVILGPVALERFAKSLIKLGRNAGLEEAAQKCKQLEVAIDGSGAAYYRPADARQCVATIESLKDKA